MRSLMKLVVMGIQPVYLQNQYTKYDIFIRACENNFQEKILNLANGEYLSNHNQYAFNIICQSCDLSIVSTIVEKYSKYLDLNLGLVNTCTHGNYQNFIYLLDRSALSDETLYKLITCTVCGYEEYKYKKTALEEIYNHLITLIKNPDYMHLLKSNANKPYSSFKIFKQLIKKVHNIKPIDIFTFVCLVDNVQKAKYLYTIYSNELNEYINFNFDFFIKLCDCECFKCVEFLCIINGKKNYCVKITHRVSGNGNGCYDVINYRVKDNNGNIIGQYINPDKQDPNEKLIDFDSDSDSDFD